MTTNRNDFAEPASLLIEPDSSAMSLDGRSLNIPNDGIEEDMSSLGTSKYGGYNFSVGNAIGYIGDMRIVGRAEDYDNERGISVPPRRSPTQSPYGSGAGDYDFQRTDYSVQTEDHGGPPDQMEQEKRKNDVMEKPLEKPDCMPEWLIDAPFWLKLVILCSTALLIGAVVLVAVGAVLARGVGSSSSTATQEQRQPGGSPPDNTVSPIVMTSAPSAAPIQQSSPVDDIRVSPTLSPSTNPMLLPSADPTFKSSTLSPTIIEANTTTEIPTMITSADTTEATSQTASDDSPVVNFYAIGGRFDESNLSALTDDIQTLPNIDGNTVLFHLGDWNSPFATSCVESSYTSNVQIYQQSSIPVYFVPGDNEFNDCPNPDQALSFWQDNLLGFETRYWPAPTWNVTRQTPDHPEHFAFVQQNVLFLGLNLVGGIVHNAVEWSTRHNASLQWFNETVVSLDDTISTVVIVAHADPDVDINQGFFTPFFPLVQTLGKKIIYVHRNLGIDSWQLEAGFNGISNLDVVVVEGSLWPPMWLQIKTETGAVSIDQGTWYQDYLANGAMPSAPPM